MKKSTLYQLRFLIALAVFLTIMYLIGQTMAMFNYAWTVSVGLQEPADQVTEIGVAFNKGFGFGDTIVYIPLLFIGIVGLIKRTRIGIYAMFGAMAITSYWTTVALSALYFAKETPGWGFVDYGSYTPLLTFICLYGLWGMIFLFRNSERILNDRV